jgi:hypothetical protein
MEQEHEVWRGEEEDVCVEFCQLFREKGIGFRVEQRAFGMSKYHVDRSFVIFVPDEFEEDAKAVIDEYFEASSVGVAEDDESQALSEAPEGALDVLTAEERARRERSPHREEEMNVEIWRDTTDETSAAYVNTCLRENEIGCRVAEGSDGFSRVFVAADDEKPAREIVREMREGPPQ